MVLFLIICNRLVAPPWLLVFVIAEKVVATAFSVACFVLEWWKMKLGNVNAICHRENIACMYM